MFIRFNDRLININSIHYIERLIFIDDERYLVENWIKAREDLRKINFTAIKFQILMHRPNFPLTMIERFDSYDEFNAVWQLLERLTDVINPSSAIANAHQG